MKRWPIDQYRVRGRHLGETIIHLEPTFVITTEQCQQGYSTANTHCYMPAGCFKNGDVKLRKHPNIKGHKAQKAIGA